MSTYMITGPCAYVQDGALVRHRQAGAEVELDDETAAKLGGLVKPKNGEPAAPQPAAPEPAAPQLFEPTPPETAA